MEAGSEGWTRGKTPLDWTLAEPGGHAWTIRGAETDPSGGMVALFRMAAGEAVPSRGGDFLTVEERHGVGVFRSPAEAKVVAALLCADDVADGDLDLALGDYQAGPASEERQSWLRWLGHTRLSVHRGGDESPESVVVQMFHRDEPGTIHLLLILQPDGRGSRAAFPEGHRDHPLCKALLFIDLLARHRHLRDPLTEADHDAWRHTDAIPLPPPNPVREAKARHNALLGQLFSSGMPVDEAQALLESARRVEEAGVAPEALAPHVEAAFEGKPHGASLAEAVSGSPFEQYVILALTHGVEGADAIVANATPAPGR